MPRGTVYGRLGPTMLDSAIRFEGFDTQDWSRLLSLWPTPAADARGAAPGLVLVHDGRRVRKAIRSDLRTVDELEDRWPLSLAEVAAKHGAPWVVALHAGVLEDLAEQIAARTKRSDDMLEQVLTAWRIARELAASKRLDTWPSAWASVPVPTRPMVVGAMRLLCPPEHVVVLAAWSEGSLWTSLALRRGAETVNFIAGPEELRAQLPVEAWDLRRAHDRLVQQVCDWMGPVALAVSAEQRDWQELAAGGGGWVQAVGRGRLVVAPVPAGVAVPIAVDAARVAFMLARGFVQRVVPGRPGMAEPWDSAAARVAQLADLWEVTRVLFRMGRAPDGDRA